MMLSLSRPAGHVNEPASIDAPPLLSVEGVQQVYSNDNGMQPTQVLDNISFQVWAGQFICLIGPSGCGKTTLLRILGGLLQPTGGRVCLRGETLTGPRREIGYVFQHANLMPWRTILRNVALPLEVQGIAETERIQRARNTLNLVGLSGFEDAYPRQLSGGMAQRAALARTLVHEPELLLLDEPFGALDAITRERMNLELLRTLAPDLYADAGSTARYTAVMVTHSIQEAVFLADRVLLMGPRPGHIVQEFFIPFPRPRTPDLLGTARFNKLAQTIRQAIDDQD